MSASDPFLSPPTTGSAPVPFLTSTGSRPSSPNRFPSAAYPTHTLPTPPLSTTNPFQFDPAPSTSSGSSRSSSFNTQPTVNNNNNSNPYFDSLAPPVPTMMTRAASSSSGSVHPHAGASGLGAIASSQQQGAPPIISYDPNNSPSDFDEDDDDGEGAAPGRPRKRKSTRDLRATASAQAGAQASSSKAGGGGNGAPSGDDDKDDDKGRRKIQIEYIEEKSKRHITFSKRKAGIMKKAYELSTLTGTQVLLLVVSESGWVYTFTTDKFKPLVKEDANGELSQGQKLIAACLEGKESMPNLIPGSYQPAASSVAGNFEANSAQHGGQISLKTNQRNGRPTATNRRVSSKGRQHIPVAINTGPGLSIDNSLPCPPGSGGIPPVPQLPTPHSGGYLDLASPLSPRDPRSMSHPVSPARTHYGAMQQQQAQAQAQHQGYSQGHEYAEMMHRAELMQLQNGGYADDQGGYDMSYPLPSNPMGQNHNNLHSLHDPHNGYSNSNLSQGQPQSIHNPPPQRTLHHARSQPHLRQHSISNDSASAYDLYGAHPGAPTSQSSTGAGGGGNYTHVRDASAGSQYGQAGIDPRQNGVNTGYQTPMHSGNNGGGGGSQASSVHNTPHGHQQQHLPLYATDDQYSGR
ncbi:hypothetical protein JCM11491_002453 [Sporobolomyces phaffii]